MARSALIILILLCSLAAVRAQAPALLDVKKAAEAGNATAQKQLGKHYELASQFAEAEKWYLKAAVQREVEALYCLAYFYEKGKRGLKPESSVKPKRQASLALYHMLSATGHPNALYDLARQYNDGSGTPRDPARAYQLFRLAGLPSAKPTLDRLILELKTAEVEEAEKLISSFKPVPLNTAFSKMVESQLKVQTGFVTDRQKIVAINDVVFAEGETNTVEVAGLPLLIKCVTIDKPNVGVIFEDQLYLLGNPQKRK